MTDKDRMKAEIVGLERRVQHLEDFIARLEAGLARPGVTPSFVQRVRELRQDMPE